MQKVRKWYEENRGRKLAVLIFGAFGYALLAALGSQIEQFGATTWSRSLARFAAAFPIAFVALLLLLGGLMPRLVSIHETKAKRPFRTGIAFLLIFASFLPMFLIEYPGSFVYDSHSHVMQVSSHVYSTFHPLLYTLLLKAGISTYRLVQSLEKCMAAIIVFQMLIVAFCFALSCASLSRSCSRRAARWALAAFMLWPYHAALASNYTKDTLFSAFLTLFFALTLEMLQTRQINRSLFVGATVCGALACLMRNNMIYAMFAWGVLLLVGKKPIRRIAVCALAACVLSTGVNTALMTVLHAEDGDVREMLSVPTQQLARAYALSPESFGEEERKQLDALIERQSYLQYDPTIADRVKNNIDVETLQADPAGAAAFWLRIGKRCPGIYLDAFLNTALPMLYPYRVYASTPDYIETGLAEYAVAPPFGQEEPVQPRRFRAVREWLAANVWSNGAKDIPVLRWVMNAGVVIWLMLLAVLFAMYTGSWQRFAVLLLPVLLWGTYLLGPVIQGRYLYPFVCLLPLMLAACKAKEE